MKEFDKIIGYEGVKAELERICDIMVNGEKYKKLGVTMPRGLLLYGEPGVGKTLMANCLIEACGRKAYVCRKNQPDGDFVKSIKSLFDEAKANAPSVVFLDDLDKFTNEDDDHPNAEEYVTVQSCMDDCADIGVFVLATANDRDCLPDSLLRAGRFDFVIEVENPYGDDATEIVRYYLNQKSYVGEMDAAEIARMLDGSSCAELEAVVNRAGMTAGFAGKEKIDMDDMLEASLSVLFGMSESEDMTEEELKKVAYHQAGHVVIAEALEPENVTLVSVCDAENYDNGDERGITLYCRKDSYFLYKKYMETRVMSLLGGKAATEIKYGDQDVCCNNDIDRAYRIARRFTDWYCGTSFDCRKNDYNNSDSLLDRSELHIAFDMERYYGRARRLLVANDGFLEKLAAELVVKKTLTSRDIAKIKADCKIITA